MSDPISQKTTQQVARLARIHLSEDEVRHFQQELSSVLGFIDRLDEVELPAGTQPFFGAVESVNAIRADVIADSFPRETMLENAPDTDGEFYRVPPVFST